MGGGWSPHRGRNPRGGCGANHLLTVAPRCCGMTRYRRARIAGGSYFFTVALADRRSCALVEEVALLREVYGRVARERPFRTEAIVILPDHLHAVWTLPEGDSDYSTRWKGIKAGFSRECRAVGRERPSLARKGERGVWQRRFWEHAIRDEADFAAHVEYCRINPVKHGLVAEPEAWPWSSFRQKA